MATMPFFDRPFLVVDERLPALLAAPIEDEALRRLPLGVGTIEQWVDNVEVLSRSSNRAAAQVAYRQLLAAGQLPR